MINHGPRIGRQSRHGTAQMRVNLQHLFNAGWFEQGRGDALLHHEDDTFTGLNADGRRAELGTRVDVRECTGEEGRMSWVCGQRSHYDSQARTSPPPHGRYQTHLNRLMRVLHLEEPALRRERAHTTVILGAVNERWTAAVSRQWQWH